MVVAREEMCMEGGLEIAKHFVVYPQGSGHGEKHVPRSGHIIQVLAPLRRGQGIEVRYHWVGKEKAVAADKLHVAKHQPARRHAGDDSGIVATSGGFYSAMN